MKKRFQLLFLLLFVSALALASCTDNLEITPKMEEIQEVNLIDVGFDTDQTPPDTAAVIR
jgi:hypothetical protein